MKWERKGVGVGKILKPGFELRTPVAQQIATRLLAPTVSFLYDYTCLRSQLNLSTLDWLFFIPKLHDNNFFFL